MKTFNLTIFDGHPIIHNNNNVILIDTGAPSTIHITDSLTFLANTYSTTTDYMGMSIAAISEQLGMNITSLMGIDILSEYHLLIDYQNNNIGFSKNKIDLHGKEISITSIIGVPIIELVIDGKKLKFFLDTGAKLSYLSNTITNNYKSIGTEKDFYPGVGEFETNCYKITTTIGENSFKVKYGNLPQLLQMTLMLGGTDGIMGYDFFNNFKVMLDLNNNLLKYGK